MSLQVPFRASDFGPPDNREAQARDAILGDESECAAIAKTVREFFNDTLDELCSGAYSLDGAAAVGRRITQYAEAEISRRVHARLMRGAN